MKTLLTYGQVLVACGMQSACTVREMLGEGGQAEVYRVEIGEMEFAAKWYRSEYVQADRRLWDRLREAVKRGMPSEKYLWPFDLVTLRGSSSSGGYLMPLKERQFISLIDLIKRRTEPSFRTLTTVGFHLAHSFLRLHASGLCYRDINFGNVFFHPKTGDVRIGDTDNVDIDGMPGGIMGTWGFMAPEVGRRQVEPSSRSDRFSLAVLLFFLFMLGHPLKGKRETELGYDSTDPDGSRRLCAENPIFVFDPTDDSNRPVTGVHDAVANFWPIYPKSVRDLFTSGFTVGLSDPDSRVMDNDWRKEMCRLKDSIFDCECGAELFFDIERLRGAGSLAPCWSCQKTPQLPARMRIGNSRSTTLFILSPGSALFPHHLESDDYNFLAPLAQVVGAPLGLKNLSRSPWIYRAPDESLAELAPGAVLSLDKNYRIYFGKMDAEVRLG